MIYYFVFTDYYKSWFDKIIFAEVSILLWYFYSNFTKYASIPFYASVTWNLKSPIPNMVQIYRVLL